MIARSGAREEGGPRRCHLAGDQARKVLSQGGRRAHGQRADVGIGGGGGSVAAACVRSPDAGQRDDSPRFTVVLAGIAVPRLVFLDTQSIPASADHTITLLERVRTAQVVLAVIGPHC